MTESRAKALYAAGAAILAVLGAFGIIDGATQAQWLTAVQGGITFASAIIPVVAHRRVGAAGVDPVAGLPDEAAGLPDGLDLAAESTAPRHSQEN